MYVHRFWWAWFLWFRRYGFNSISDCDLELALAISQVQANETIRLQEEEDEELRRVLKLSLTDK